MDLITIKSFPESSTNWYLHGKLPGGIRFWWQAWYLQPHLLTSIRSLFVWTRPWLKGFTLVLFAYFPRQSNKFWLQTQLQCTGGGKASQKKCEAAADEFCRALLWGRHPQLEELSSTGATWLGVLWFTAADNLALRLWLWSQKTKCLRNTRWKWKRKKKKSISRFLQNY